MKSVNYTLAACLGILFLSAAPLALAAVPTATSTPPAVPNHIIDGNVVRVGRTIQIDDAVKGDVIVAGNSVTINGPVDGDVIAAGNFIRIKGLVNGSIRVVGNSIEISNQVGHNVWAAGNIISLASAASVGWDVSAAGSTIEIAGPVAGNVAVTGSAIVIDTSVGKNVDAALDSAGQLQLGKNANVSGTVTYHAERDEQLVRADGAKIAGLISREKGNVGAEAQLSRAAIFASIFLRIITLFSYLVIGMVLVTIFSKPLLLVYDEMIKQPVQSIGRGLLYVIVIPAIVFLLLITVIGLPLGLMIIPFYLIGLYLANIFAGFALGLLLLNQTAVEKKYKGSLVWPMVIGLVITVILSSIFVLGFFIKLVLILWGVGAAAKLIRSALPEYR